MAKKDGSIISEWVECAKSEERPTQMRARYPKGPIREVAGLPYVRGNVSRARSQKSTRDERASIERRWCSFDVGERDTDDAKILQDIMRRNAPPRGGMGIRAALTRGDGKRKAYPRTSWLIALNGEIARRGNVHRTCALESPGAVWGARRITSAVYSNVGSQKDGTLVAQYYTPVTNEVP
ncbi:hypothetical protein K438DRAFT_1762320 [Mycena galopus ATCC 62051]|nr:hypothetical protein K438DRAFT_1762320 [Mycena galopus ATCC 62051]